MNAQEAALIEANRNKGNGQFGERRRRAPELTLGAEDPAIARRERMNNRTEQLLADLSVARRAVNNHRVAIAADELAAEGMAVGRVFIEGDNRSWWVSQAQDPDGGELSFDDAERIRRAMEDAGVEYDMSLRINGADFAALNAETYEDDLPDDTPAGYVNRQVRDTEKAVASVCANSDDPLIIAQDFLSGFRHWADAKGISFSDAADSSYLIYAEEARNARAQTEGNAA